MDSLLQSRKVLAMMLFLALVLGLAPAPGLCADNPPNEYELKAVMLFNLARFVEWPQEAFASSNSPIVIGVIGRNPFGPALVNAVQGEMVNGRRIVVEHYENFAALKTCHILYICSNQKSKVPQILAKLRGQPVLSVSEIDGFSTLLGGMVRFYTNDENKIRLRLNLQSTRAAGLNVSSKLIQVAELEKTSLLWPLPPHRPGIIFAPDLARSGTPRFPR